MSVETWEAKPSRDGRGSEAMADKDKRKNTKIGGRKGTEDQKTPNKKTQRTRTKNLEDSDRLSWHRLPGQVDSQLRARHRG